MNECIISYKNRLDWEAIVIWRIAGHFKYFVVDAFSVQLVHDMHFYNFNSKYEEENCSEFVLF